MLSWGLQAGVGFSPWCGPPGGTLGVQDLPEVVLGWQPPVALLQQHEARRWLGGGWVVLAQPAAARCAFGVGRDRQRGHL